MLDDHSISARLLILGAGGHAREVCLTALRSRSAPYQPLAFLSDDESTHTTQLCGLTVVGPVLPDVIRKFKPDYIVVGVGSPDIRRRLCLRMLEEFEFATIIDQSVQLLDQSLEIGVGSVVFAGSILSTQVKIGRHVNINLNCTVSHDTEIGDFCNLSPGVHLCGGVRLAEGVDLGVGAVVLPLVKIGKNAVIGAGAVVRQDVPENAVVAGVPAKIIRMRALEPCCE
jgi:sugar O-acyltransferase (sialic acid O-acetyltransferase NeuD family)